ncbi:hypothetical protein DC415_07645 [Agrobacterium tumefaciens]|uniref:Uncharacterized protein n=1 Tax=Rhizobium rhizogenes TaxID=359 RepID=A0AA92C2R2_RHIRH|nr:hypothetical protein DC430_11035 [Rhizobium rhizogenes]PVE66300.1 hypothetical protein DC415_07645 [Agrobacterium tumefaciens]PVE76288.1 hypothetical protein DCP16_07645 [Sphingomonas sp. TPD3009]
MTDNWEEECCQSNRATLGGGVRRFDACKIQEFPFENRHIIAAQHCVNCIAMACPIAFSTKCA